MYKGLPCQWTRAKTERRSLFNNAIVLEGQLRKFATTLKMDQSKKLNDEVFSTTIVLEAQWRTFAYVCGQLAYDCVRMDQLKQ